MCRFVHVVPVGTSLLGNFSRDYRDKVVGWGFDGWDRWSPDDPRQSRLCEASWVVGELLEFVRGRGFKASAELSPLEEALSVFMQRVEDVCVFLYSTETCNSKTVREVVARFLRERGFRVFEEEIESTRSSEEFERGLISLIDKIVRRVSEWKKRGSIVMINATPGFKAEASFLVIASLLAGADAVYYMHESFRELVLLPALPIEIKREYIEIAKNFTTPRTQREAEEILGSPERVRELEIRGLIKRRPEGDYTTREWIRELIKVLE